MGVEAKDRILRIYGDPNNPPFTNLTADQYLRTKIVSYRPKQSSQPNIVNVELADSLKTARQIAREKELPFFVDMKNIH